MPLSSKVWSCKPLDGGSLIMRKTLKSICAEIGWKYNTAKKREFVEGGIVRLVVSNKAYEIWYNEVQK